MPMNPMTGEMMPYDDVDAMAMEQALGGSPSMDPGMDPGMGEMVPVSVPSWAVPAVQELISILESEIASGAISPDMLMDPGMGAGGPMMGAPMDGGMPMDPMMGGGPF
jgi:hypothetical protein